VSYTRSRRYVTTLAYWGATVGTYVPDELSLPERDVLMLTRVARWRAMTMVRAYNAAQRIFWASMGYEPTGFGQAGLIDADLDGFFAWVCGTEPYAPELGRRCATDVAGLEAAAAYFFGPNIEEARRLTVAAGTARALKDAAVQGYSFGWPGDEQFCRELVRRCGLGTGGGRGDNPAAWYVDLFNVNGSLRWVAVDGLTLFGVDVVSSREREAVVIYAPEDLRLGSQPALLSYAPTTAPAAMVTLAETAIAATSAPTTLNTMTVGTASEATVNSLATARIAAFGKVG
jgi:hypothetical protein